VIPGQPLRLLEVKCPVVMKNYDPKDFETKMTKSQKRNCALLKIGNNFMMKASHSHLNQVQMQMDIMNIQTCDYFVWTRHGHICVTMAYDEVLWAPKRNELVTHHYQFLVPEYFLQGYPEIYLSMSSLQVKYDNRPFRQRIRAIWQRCMAHAQSGHFFGGQELR